MLLIAEDGCPEGQVTDTRINFASFVWPPVADSKRTTCRERIQRQQENPWLSRFLSAGISNDPMRAFGNWFRSGSREKCVAGEESQKPCFPAVAPLATDSIANSRNPALYLSLLVSSRVFAMKS